jgi:limonene 1,2-monooxygenase
MSITLRHGVFISPFHRLEQSPTLTMEQDFQLIEWLDMLGFEEAWVGEHHSSGYETIASPELFIATAAARTHRIKLGTGVISLPYHNPLMVANRIIQLDHATRGRVMFGAGPGLLASDAAMLGIDPAVQRRRMAEAIDVILRLFAGETVTETTDWYTLVEARAHLLPYTRPRPEVAVASSLTPSGGLMAGRHGLSMLCVANGIVDGVDILVQNWGIACEMAAEHGHEMHREQLRVVQPMHIAETREEAAASCRDGLRYYVDYMTNNVMPLEIPAGADPVQWWTEAGLGIIGTPDDAIAAIQRIYDRYGEFGCVLNFPNTFAGFEATRKSFELYANYVMPHFRQTNLNRQASYDWVHDNRDRLGRQRSNAVKAMVAQHKAEGEAGQAEGLGDRPRAV